MHTLGRVVWGNVLPASSDFFPLNLEEPNIGCRYYLGTLEDLGTDAPCLASGIAVVETNKKKIIRVHADVFHPSGYCALAQDLHVLGQIF